MSMGGKILPPGRAELAEQLKNSEGLQRRLRHTRGRVGLKASTTLAFSGFQITHLPVSDWKLGKIYKITSSRVSGGSGTFFLFYPIL